MKNTVTQQQINEMWNKATIQVATVFDKCTVVSCQLENGFIIVESSACVDPANYDKDMGYKICKERIINKLWELEGYRLQQQLHEEKKKQPIPKRGSGYTGHVNCKCTIIPVDERTAHTIESCIKERACSDYVNGPYRQYTK